MPETSPPGKRWRTGLGGFPSPLARGCCRVSACGLLCSGVVVLARVSGCLLAPSGSLLGRGEGGGWSLSVCRGWGCPVARAQAGLGRAGGRLNGPGWGRSGCDILPQGDALVWSSSTPHLWVSTRHPAPRTHLGLRLGRGPTLGLQTDPDARQAGCHSVGTGSDGPRGEGPDTGGSFTSFICSHPNGRAALDSAASLGAPPVQAGSGQ